MVRMLHLWHSLGMTTPIEVSTKTPTDGPWVPNLDSFGARLALVRQKMGWGNVAEAARECGLERESWRLWEQGGREPRRITTIAMAIATRTGVDPDWLIWGPDRGKVPAGRVTTQYPTPRIEDLAPHIRTFPIGPLPRGEITFGDGRKGPRQVRRRPVALSA